MALITNGKTIIEVPDEKAERYCLSMGYHIIQQETPVEVVETPKPRRGRPPKKAN